MEIINAYLYKIVVTLLLALAAWLGVQVKNLVKKYVNTKIKERVCAAAVRFVEQVYQELHGRDKLLKAMKKARDVLAKYGITITDEELEMLLEAAVNEFNNSFKKTDPEAKEKDEQVKRLDKLPVWD